MTESQQSQLLDMTALILCGGRSRRMGRPKAFLPYEGSTVISHILDTVSSLFAEVLLISNEPESYEDLGVDVVKDILPYRGPMGGILSGLLVAGHEHVFVIACDMPLVDRALILELVKRRHEHDVVVVSHCLGVEPLLGVYSKNCIKPLEESLFSGSLSVKDLLFDLTTDTVRLDGEKGEELPPFFNINTPQDYSRLITGQVTPVHKFAQRSKR
ncbi:MAG: molybdenum cofactor guanylyltransferase [Candidatus Obscuribacterales bacterium]|nr:molybdenum cofactor guanylyltransferase [Candidatus Obscuribacterales bacterium]